jgi:hypothetical protein
VVQPIESVGMSKEPGVKKQIRVGFKRFSICNFFGGCVRTGEWLKVTRR